MAPPVVAEPPLLQLMDSDFPKTHFRKVVAYFRQSPRTANADANSTLEIYHEQLQVLDLRQRNRGQDAAAVPQLVLRDRCCLRVTKPLEHSGELAQVLHRSWLEPVVPLTPPQPTIRRSPRIRRHRSRHRIQRSPPEAPHPGQPFRVWPKLRCTRITTSVGTAEPRVLEAVERSYH